PDDGLLEHFIIECPGLRLELDIPELIEGIRKIEAFVLPNPEGNLADLLGELLEIPVPDDLIATVASHDGVPITELPEAASENPVIQELVLREVVQRGLRNRCAGENHAVPGVPTNPDTCLRLLGLKPLDLLTLVEDDHVGLPALELLFEPPGRFVIHSDDEEAFDVLRVRLAEE